MATDLEKLVVQLSADIKSYEKALARANGVTNKQFNAIERRARAMNKVFDTVLGSLGNTLAGAFAGTAALRGAQVLVDAATRISNALKIAGLSGEELSKVYDELFGSAQRNGAPIEALVTLYSRASQSAKDLGVSQQELLKFTDTVAMSLRASGQSSEEAAGALLQLSQALGNGVVQAEEYNSLIDGAQPLLQAAAAGLKEAGGSVSALTRLVKEGKVSSEAFFRAIEAGSYVLENQVAASTFTVSQRFQQLENVLIDTAGELDAATGASKRFGDTIEGLAGGIQVLGSALTTIASSDLASFLGKLIEVNNTAQDLYTLLGRLPGVVKTMASINLDVVNGRKPGASMQADQIQSRIDGAFATVPSSGEVKTTPKTNRLPFKPKGKTVSLDDFKLPTKEKKTAGGGSKVDDYAREIAAIKERTASMQAAYAAQAALNPLVDDYGYSVEKAAARQELMNAAQKAGKEITPQLAGNIDAAAEAYARAGAQAEKLSESQGKIRAAAQDANALNKDLTRGVIDGFTSGTKAADIFADSLKKIGDNLLDMALNAAFDSKSGGGGGFLGNILGGIGSIFTGGKSTDPWKGLRLANGGSVRGPGTGRSDSIPAMLSNGEYVINARAAAKNPVLLDIINSGKRLQFMADGGAVSPTLRAPKMPDLSKLPMRNAGGGAAPSFTFAPVIDARGADQAAVTRLEGIVAKQAREFQGNVKQAIISLRARNAKI